MTEKREYSHIVNALHARMFITHKSRSAFRLLVFVFLLVCATLGMFTSLIFLASDGQPAKMMGVLSLVLEHVSLWRLIRMSDVISVLEILLIVLLSNLLLPTLLVIYRAKDIEKTEQSLIQMIAHTLAVPVNQIQRTGDFFEYGGDSVSLDALLSTIKQQWQIPLEAHDIFNHPQVSHLATVIVYRQWQREEMGRWIRSYAR